MTSKDYKMLAELFKQERLHSKGHKPANVLNHLEASLVIKLAEDNPRFNKIEFYRKANPC